MSATTAITGTDNATHQGISILALMPKSSMDSVLAAKSQEEFVKEIGSAWAETLTYLPFSYLLATGKDPREFPILSSYPLQTQQDPEGAFSNSTAGKESFLSNAREINPKDFSDLYELKNLAERSIRDFPSFVPPPAGSLAAFAMEGDPAEQRRKMKSIASREETFEKMNFAIRFAHKHMDLQIGQITLEKAETPGELEPKYFDHLRVCSDQNDWNFHTAPYIEIHDITRKVIAEFLSNASVYAGKSGCEDRLTTEELSAYAESVQRRLRERYKELKTLDLLSEMAFSSSDLE